MSTLPQRGPRLLQEGEALGPQGQLLLTFLGQLQNPGRGFGCAQRVAAETEAQKPARGELPLAKAPPLLSEDCWGSRAGIWIPPSSKDVSKMSLQHTPLPI